MCFVSFAENDAPCMAAVSCFMLFVVGDQLFACQIIEERAVLFLIGEVAGKWSVPARLSRWRPSADRFHVIIASESLP